MKQERKRTYEWKSKQERKGNKRENGTRKKREKKKRKTLSFGIIVCSPRHGAYPRLISVQSINHTDIDHTTPWSQVFLDVPPAPTLPSIHGPLRSNAAM